MKHLTLFQLNRVVRKTLDENLEPSYWVIAEIGEMRLHASGHCYLELVEKEEDKIIAKLRGTIWAYTYRNLSIWFENITGQALKKGLKILFNANVQFHELYGLSLNIKDIDANFTLGERARRRQEIIEQLKQDGVFDLNKQLVLPTVAQNIAIISSPSAAGFGDFTAQVENNQRGYRFRIKLYKAVMQGEKAVESMINALLTVANEAEQPDVVAIIRGGGSQIDLDCFDSYDLAAHVAQFPIPVLTGIGHERDETITDMVAHTRLKTPTAVAEFLVSGMSAYEEQLEALFTRLYQGVLGKIRSREQHLDNCRQRLTAASKGAIIKAGHQLDLLLKQLQAASKHNLSRHKAELEMLQKTLDLVDPGKILARGYTLTTIDGKRIKAGMAKKGGLLKTYLPGEIISSKVEGTDKQSL